LSRIPREFSQQATCTLFSKRAPVIVNGWASFEYWNGYSHEFAGTRAIVVRESPRHFGFSGEQISWQDLVNVFSSFDSLIFVSDQVRQEWLDVPELHGKQAFVLPNCCEEEAVRSLQQIGWKTNRQRLGISADQFVIVCPGTLIERKGMDLLLSIIPALDKEIPELKVVFVGAAPGEWGQDRVKEISQVRNAKWVGVQPTALEYIYAADVMAFPTRAEAMPRVVLEAMALGTAVVASSVDGIPELVTDKTTGILIEPDDEDALLAGIVTLARNSELRSTYAAAGSACYEQHFSRRRQIERLATILPSL
jgi:glycosyltransferase involved in cell wall biosynthesis